MIIPTEPIKLELPLGKPLRLLEDYPFEIDGRRMVIPVGFETDFASVPFGFRNLIPKMGEHSHPAVVHDYLCSIGYHKKTTDLFFLAHMEAANVPTWKRRVIYRGVRLYSPFRKGER